MDKKYGRIFTEADVERIVSVAQGDPDLDFDSVIDFVSDESNFVFPENEPLFVIRGKDQAAIQTLIDYRANAKVVGAGGQHLARVSETERVFRDFAQNNIDVMKIPD